MSHNYVYMLVYIYGIGRYLFISIAITLAMNIFLYCTNTSKILNIEFVKVIKMICGYIV